MNKTHFITVAMLEGLVMTSAIMRIVLPGGLDFEHPPTLVWFVATIVLAASSITFFTIRNAALTRREQAGEKLEDERKQMFIVSIAIVIAAVMLSAAGPMSFAKLMG